MFETLGRMFNLGKDKLDKWLDENEDNVAVANRELRAAKIECAELAVKFGECSAQMSSDKAEYEKAEFEVKDYQRIAEEAYKAGDMADAERACEKQSFWEEELKVRKETYEISKKTLDEMQASIITYKRDIDTIESSISRLEAKSARVDAINASTKMEAVNCGSHRDNISKAEKKIDAKLESAKAMHELEKSSSLGDDLKSKYSATSSSTSEKMKALQEKFSK